MIKIVEELSNYGKASGQEMTIERHNLNKAIKSIESLCDALGRRERSNEEHRFLFKDSPMLLSELKSLKLKTDR